MPYLDRMVMKVCDHNLILVVHGHKVRTCKQQQERHREHEPSGESSSAFTRQERKFHTIFGLEKEKKMKQKKNNETHNGHREALDVLMWDGCVRHEQSRCSDTLRRRYRRFATFIGELITY